MTNAEVQAGFTEVYNQFWLNYRDKPLPKDSDEWERMHTWAVVLMKKYPFLRDTVAGMVEELDQRMRRRYYEPGRKTACGEAEDGQKASKGADRTNIPPGSGK